MTDRKAWMVRAGPSGRVFDVFKEQSIVAIGWERIGDLHNYRSRDQIVALVRDAYPEFREQAVSNAAGQLYRFACEFKRGDRVVTYDPGARQYLLGNITGDYVYAGINEREELINRRSVSWNDKEKPRDEISAAARNVLGSTLALFLIPNQVAAELWGDSAAITDNNIRIPDTADADGLASAVGPQTDEDMASQASETIKDAIAALGWSEMQELVAGLLRAMGYKTTISPLGPDRGKDIVASPDGLGFQEPRIVVEVKHQRTQRMGSQEIRSFLGGRHPADKGLYVSTGGFSRDAYYEAERASIPLMLMDFEALVQEILDRYHNFDEKTKQILPLRRLYWPIKQ